MAHKVSFLASTLIILLIIAMATQARAFNVQSYGARPDGSTDSSKAFLAAWEQACKSSVPAAMYVPQGKYSLGKVTFQGPCNNRKIAFTIDGTLVAPHYSSIGNKQNWILFEHVDGVTISGGILDGQGASLWSCKSSGKGCPEGVTSLEFSNSNNIEIDGLASQDSEKFHIVINGCNNVKVHNVKVSAAGDSPNTDGIHVQESSGVNIINSKIGTGDDCISIGPGTSNLWIESIACGPGHGISIGSLGKELQEDGVEHVTVRSCTISGTQNGVRIKSWGRSSNGFARNILFQHIVMSNVENPILIDQNYCPGEKNCPGQESGVKISDVTYQDIHGTSASEVAVKFDCSRKYPCSGLQLEDVKLTYGSRPAEASCINADGRASGFLQPSSCL